MKLLARRFNIYLALAVLLGLGLRLPDRQENINRRPARAYRGESRPHRRKPEHFRAALQSCARHHQTRTDFVGSQHRQRQGLQRHGRFCPRVQIRRNGTWLLEQYSAANPGAHFVIFGQWGKKNGDGRWLADPFIGRRISNGTLVFTPDCSREEADRLVLGLNEIAKKTTKKYSNDFSRG